MFIIEIICAAIVASYWGISLWRNENKGEFTLTMLSITAASWIAEDSAISAYHFYQYNRGFHYFIHHVPLLIVCIWPVVIHSAWLLSKKIARPKWVPLTSALVVLTDAALIEPVSVNAKLWSWNEPGFFGVPPIGVLGWAFFTVGATIVLGRSEKSSSSIKHASILIFAPLVAHFLLLVAWWTLFRWINRPISDGAAFIGALVACILLAWTSLKMKWHRCVPLSTLMNRAPGALFFFVLMAIFAHPTLLAFGLCFALPYMAALLPRLAKA